MLENHPPTKVTVLAIHSQQTENLTKQPPTQCWAPMRLVVICRQPEPDSPYDHELHRQHLIYQMLWQDQN